MHSSRRSPEGCGAEYARKANQNDPPFGTEAPSDTAIDCLSIQSIALAPLTEVENPHLTTSSARASRALGRSRPAI